MSKCAGLVSDNLSCVLGGRRLRLGALLCRSILKKIPYIHKYLKRREPKCKATLELVDWVIKCLMASSQQEAVI